MSFRDMARVLVRLLALSVVLWLSGGAEAQIECQPNPAAPRATLERAFAFGMRDLSCPTYNDPQVDYTMVLQVGGDPLSIAYTEDKGFGYEVLYTDGLNFPDLPPPIHSPRGGWEIYGPMDDSPNNRTKYPDSCPEEIYDSFIGAKNFLNQTGCNQNMSTPPEPNLPCVDGGLETDGVIFRVDVPNGRYRFVGAFGDADNPHAHRVLVEDGGEGPPPNIGSHAVLVHNFDQSQYSIGEADARKGEGVYARVGFECKIPPPGDEEFPSPMFVNLDSDGWPTDAFPDSPTLEVTQGYIRFHFLQANSNAGPGSPGGGDPNGGDAVVLEIWRLETVPPPPPEPSFRRADADGDGKVDLTDSIHTLSFLFLGGPAPKCQDAADADDTGIVELTDAIYSLLWQFVGGPEPPAPGPRDCGRDLIADALVPCDYGGCP